MDPPSTTIDPRNPALVTASAPLASSLPSKPLSQNASVPQPQRRLKKLAPFSVKPLSNDSTSGFNEDAQDGNMDFPDLSENSSSSADTKQVVSTTAEAVPETTAVTSSLSTPVLSSSSSDVPAQAQLQQQNPATDVATAPPTTAGAGAAQGPAVPGPRRRERKDDSAVDLLLLFLFLFMIFGSLFLFFFSDLFLAHATRGGGRKMTDTTFRLMVSLESVATGATVESDFPGGGRQVVCNQCQGSGADGGKGGGHFHTCNACDGKGFISYRRQIAPGFYQDVRQNCHVCNGRGSVVHKPCPHCDGIGLQRDNHTPLRIPLPVGVPDGFRVVLREAGDQPTVQDQARGVKIGDVIVTIQTRSDKRFTRRGQDLVYSMPLSLRQALLGFETSIHMIDGSTFHLDRKDVVTQPGEVLRIQGKGLPAFDAESALARNNALPPRNGVLSAAKAAITEVITSVQTHVLQPLENAFDKVVGVRRRHNEDEEKEAVSLPAGDFVIEFQVNFPSRSHVFTKEQQEELRKLLPQPPVVAASPKGNQRPTATKKK